MHRKSAYFLFLAVLGMLVIGIVMLFSTSAFARDSHGDMYFFVKRQAIWLGVGFVVCAVAAIVDYHFWLRTWWIWFGLALIALAFCFVPHFGMRINGSRRWVALGPATFQPSEIAKVAVLFFLAAWFGNREKESSRLLPGFVIPFAIVCTALILIVTEVDLGTTALIGATMFVVMFVAGTHPALLGLLSLGGLGGILFVATHMSERMGRLAAFMDPERFKEDAGLQQMQALIAWGSGGMEGLRSEEHTSELQSQSNIVCRLLLEKKKQDNSLVRFHHGSPVPACALTTSVYVTRTPQVRPHRTGSHSTYHIILLTAYPYHRDSAS